MSRYELGRLLFDMCRDRQMRLLTSFREHSEEVLAHYDLTDAERRQVLEGDIRGIYEAGIRPLLVRLGANALLGGIDTATYREAISGAVQAED